MPNQKVITVNSCRECFLLDRCSAYKSHTLDEKQNKIAHLKNNQFPINCPLPNQKVSRPNSEGLDLRESMIITKSFARHLAFRSDSLHAFREMLKNAITSLLDFDLPQFNQSSTLYIDFSENVKTMPIWFYFHFQPRSRVPIGIISLSKNAVSEKSDSYNLSALTSGSDIARIISVDLYRINDLIKLHGYNHFVPKKENFIDPRPGSGTHIPDFGLDYTSIENDQILVTLGYGYISQ